MRRRTSGALTICALIFGGLAATTQSALADGGAKYRVTIANATAGQPLAPALLITHRKGFLLFQNNGLASVGLGTLAETGNPGVLADEVDGAEGVKSVDVLLGQAQPPLPPVAVPGETNSIVISTSRRARFFTAAAMLGMTNDAFYAVRGIRLPDRGHIVVYANAYDAGSEINSELLADLPPNDYNPEEGEGFIHIHRGIHGGGDLDPAIHDWRNPVAKITIERLRGHGHGHDDD